MKLCFIDKSGDPELTVPSLTAIGEALSVQVARDLAGWWECTPIDFLIASSAPPGFDQFLITAQMDDPEAVAYHTVQANGRPLLRVGLDAVRQGSRPFLDELSIAMSHEVLETLRDPYADFWADYDGTKKVALEVCDPVQGDAYDIDGVKVSNFVGPRWFRRGGGPYDMMGTLTDPLTMSPGGYLAFDDGTQIFGEQVSLAKRSHVARFGRRARCAG